jgi:phosphoketolase
MTANLHANGGKLRKPLDLPDFVDFAIKVEHPGTTEVSPTATLATFLCEVMRRNMTTFRMFSPDENASNKLDGVYKASRKTWLAETLPEDCGRNRDRSRRTRDGDAQRTHHRRLAGRLPAHRPPRPAQQL